MKYVEWGGVVRIYSSGGKLRQKAQNLLNGDYSAWKKVSFTWYNWLSGCLWMQNNWAKYETAWVDRSSRAWKRLPMRWWGSTKHLQTWATSHRRRRSATRTDRTSILSCSSTRCGNTSESQRGVDEWKTSEERRRQNRRWQERQVAGRTCPPSRWVRWCLRWRRCSRWWWRLPKVLRIGRRKVVPNTLPLWLWMDTEIWK